MAAPPIILDQLHDSQEFAALWLMASAMSKLRDRCERCARTNSGAGPARLCEEDARAMIWLTATESGAPGSARLVDLDPGIFDDWKPNAVALLVDGSGTLARVVVEHWRRATVADRQGAFADLPRGTYSREAKAAANHIAAAKRVARLAAGAFAVIGETLGG